MTGTFAGALEARHIPVGEGQLTSEVVGDIVAEQDNILVIRRIHLNYTLKIDNTLHKRAAAVHSDYCDRCPVYRSLCWSIDITSELHFAAG